MQQRVEECRQFFRVEEAVGAHAAAQVDAEGLDLAHKRDITPSLNVFRIFFEFTENTVIMH